MSESRTISRPQVVAAQPGVWRAAAGRSLVADLLLLLGLALLLLLGSVWSYRQPLSYTLRAEQKHGLYTSGLYEAEGGETGWHRWTGPETLIRLPGVGRASYEATLYVHNPVTDAPRTLALSAGESQLAVLPLRPGWQQLGVTIPAALIDPGSGNLDLGLRVDPPIAGDQRQLGVAFRWLRLEQRSAALPPVGGALLLGLALLLVVAPLRVLGTPTRWAGLGVAVLLLLGLGLLAWLRIDLLIGLPPLIRALLWSLLALPLLWLWLRSQNHAALPWARAVAIVAMACFVIRFVGMLHPQFIQIDHRLRVHQIEAIASGGRAQIQAELGRQYEWGAEAVPYSLLSYDLFTPLAGRISTTSLLALVEGVNAALDASVLLLLWDIARRSRLDPRSSWWCAALFAVMPVGYLYFHDGSYPTIIGLWMTVVALWLLTLFAERPRPWLWAVGTAAITLSILMYVTHLAFVPALLGCAVASAWLWGAGPLRGVSRRIAAGLTLGFGLALLGYYGANLPRLLVETIPSYLLTLSQGGSVGRDSSLLPGQLLGTTGEQLWGHYRLISVALAAIGVLWSLRRREQWLTHLTLAYGIFLILTAIADLRFGLWNKHMYFALPGVCLAAGPLLGQLQGRGRVGSLVVWSLFGYLIWTSVGAWLLRVLVYDWSLQTL
jgi:hypothetical protein